MPKDLDPTTSLWYTQPAANWLEALPLGNGHLGAMVFGGVPHEQLVLNEDTLYSEEPGEGNVLLDITKRFDEVVDLLKQGKYIQAEAIVTHNWLGRSEPCYQPFGNLHLHFSPGGKVTNYYRQLTLKDSMHHTSYTQDGVTFERETFVSAPDNVIIYRLHADTRGALNFRVDFDSPHPTARLARSGDREVTFSGAAAGHRSPSNTGLGGGGWRYVEVSGAME